MAVKQRIKAPYKNYEENQYKIITALKAISEATGVDMPSYEAIAVESGLSTSTVRRHYANLDFGFILGREQVHTPEVVEAIRKSAKEGKYAAQKLYAQIVEKVILRTAEDKTVIGDLNVNSEAKGTIKVVIERRTVTSRDQIKQIEDGEDVPEVSVVKDNDPHTAFPVASVNVSVPLIDGAATRALLGGEVEE